MGRRLEPTRARFVVSSRSVVNVAVDGVIDAGAVRGFDAVVDWLLGTREIVIDLSDCVAMDGPGRDGLSYSVERLRRAGSAVSVVQPNSAIR